MSAMEDEVALKRGYSIPRIKGKTPLPRSLSIILKTDQGGISFRPPAPGIYENVAELDFRSLYPNIMRYHNVSGETINCLRCEKDGTKQVVPFTPYHTCSKRKGIVGDTISTLLDRREELIEELKRNLSMKEKLAITNRSEAIKWCLVTSFGYTGYKNAKYGRREAHEAITAWGRECLLSAKEIAEDRGYIFLHGLTDSLWLWKGGEKFSKDEILEITNEIYNSIQIPIIHEANYSFLVFPESKVKKGNTVATRYYGRKENGELKIRGYMVRKSDVPKIIHTFQEELFKEIGTCQSAKELELLDTKLYKIYCRYYTYITSGKLPLDELLVNKHVSGKSKDYTQNNASKIILQKLETDELEHVGGDRIEYIVFDSRARDPSKRYISIMEYDFKKGYDIQWYCRELRRAFEEVRFRETDTLFPGWV